MRRNFLHHTRHRSRPRVNVGLRLPAAKDQGGTVDSQNPDPPCAAVPDQGGRPQMEFLGRAVPRLHRPGADVAVVARHPLGPRPGRRQADRLAEPGPR